MTQTAEVHGRLSMLIFEQRKAECLLYAKAALSTLISNPRLDFFKNWGR